MRLAAREGGAARPRFLNLLQIRLPVTAAASIAHRVSGLLLVLATPVLIYLLDLSLHHPQAFGNLVHPVAGWPGRLLLLVPAWALAYHLLAGLRHLALDLGLGEARPEARASAWLVLAAGALVAIGVVL